MITNESGIEGVFTFESGDGRAVEGGELHILFVGDWRGDGVREPLSLRREVSVDRDNFDEVLKYFAPRVDVAIGAGCESVAFSSLEDFHPDTLYRDLPVFTELRSLRAGLQSRDDYERAAGRVRSWFKTDDVEKQPVAQDSGRDLLDELIGSARPLVAAGPLDEFISGIVSGHRFRIDEDERRRLTSAVDSAITAVMREILHNPAFQTLEASWRGLWFAVRRFETDIKHKFVVVDATFSEMSADLRSADDLSSSNFGRLLSGERGYGAIALNASFGMNVDDVAALIRLASIADASGAALFTHVKPEMFGRADWSVTSMVEFNEGEVGGKLWNAVRASGGAGALGASPMRMFGRLPYGSSSDPTEGFVFEEFDGVPVHEKLVWLNPCFPLALVRALGGRDGAAPREFGRLPVHTFKRDGEAVAVACAEVVLTEGGLAEIVEHGLIPLVGFRDEDRVIVGDLRSAASGA